MIEVKSVRYELTAQSHRSYSVSDELCAMPSLAARIALKMILGSSGYDFPAIHVLQYGLHGIRATIGFAMWREIQNIQTVELKGWLLQDSINGKQMALCVRDVMVDELLNASEIDIAQSLREEKEATKYQFLKLMTTMPSINYFCFCTQFLGMRSIIHEESEAVCSWYDLASHSILAHVHEHRNELSGTDMSGLCYEKIRKASDRILETRIAHYFVIERLHDEREV